MKHIAVLISLALVLALASAAHAKKGGGGKPGGGGDPGNDTPLDILFQVNSDACSGCGTLFAIQDDGSGETELASTRGGAAWSPDGSRVAFYGLENGFGVYVMDLEGGTPELLIPMANLTAGWLDWSPVPAPDGSDRLAFTMRETSSADVYVASFDDTGLLAVEQVTDTAGNEIRPTWSPDGNRISVQYGNRIRLIDLVNRDGADAPTVHTVYESSRFAPHQPAWSKTGNQIAFDAYDSQASDPLTDVFVLEVSQEVDGTWTGTTPVNVTNTPDDEEDLSDWSPDDTMLIFKNFHWRANRKGRSEASTQVLTLGTGNRAEVAIPGHHHRWRRSAP